MSKWHVIQKFTSDAEKLRKLFANWRKGEESDCRLWIGILPRFLFSLYDSGMLRKTHVPLNVVAYYFCLLSITVQVVED